MEKKERIGFYFALSCLKMLSGQQSEIVLAIDIGSSSVRCSAYNMSGSCVGSRVQLPHEPDERGFFDASALVHRVNDAVEASLAQLESTRLRVVAVGFSCFVMNLVGVDSQGNAVTPLLSYSHCGDEVGAHVERLRSRLAASGELHDTAQRTGAPLHASYAPAQLSWLAEAHPGMLERVAKWQTIPAMVQARRLLMLRT